MKKILLTMSVLITLALLMPQISAYPIGYSKTMHMNENYMVEVDLGKSVQITHTYSPEVITRNTVSVYTDDRQDRIYHYGLYHYFSPNYGTDYRTHAYTDKFGNSELKIYY